MKRFRYTEQSEAIAIISGVLFASLEPFTKLTYISWSNTTKKYIATQVITHDQVYKSSITFHPIFAYVEQYSRQIEYLELIHVFLILTKGFFWLAAIY